MKKENIALYTMAVAAAISIAILLKALIIDYANIHSNVFIWLIIIFITGISLSGAIGTIFYMGKVSDLEDQLTELNHKLKNTSK